MKKKKDFKIGLIVAVINGVFDIKPFVCPMKKRGKGAGFRRWLLQQRAAVAGTLAGQTRYAANLTSGNRVGGNSGKGA